MWIPRVGLFPLSAPLSTVQTASEEDLLHMVLVHINSWQSWVWAEPVLVPYHHCRCCFRSLYLQVVWRCPPTTVFLCLIFLRNDSSFQAKLHVPITRQLPFRLTAFTLPLQCCLVPTSQPAQHIPQCQLAWWPSDTGAEGCWGRLAPWTCLCAEWPASWRWLDCN